MAIDLNLILDQDKDKVGGNAELHETSRQLVLSNMQNHDLTEIWLNQTFTHLLHNLDSWRLLFTTIP